MKEYRCACTCPIFTYRHKFEGTPCQGGAGTVHRVLTLHTSILLYSCHLGRKVESTDKETQWQIVSVTEAYSLVPKAHSTSTPRPIHHARGSLGWCLWTHIVAFYSREWMPRMSVHRLRGPLAYPACPTRWIGMNLGVRQGPWTETYQWRRLNWVLSLAPLLSRRGSEDWVSKDGEVRHWSSRGLGPGRNLCPLSLFEPV